MSSLHPQLSTGTDEGLANVFPISPPSTLLVDLTLGPPGPGMEVRKAREGEQESYYLPVLSWPAIMLSRSGKSSKLSSFLGSLHGFCKDL